MVCEQIIAKGEKGPAGPGQALNSKTQTEEITAALRRFHLLSTA